MTIFRTFATLLAIIGTALVGSNASAEIVTLTGLDTNGQFNVNGVSTTGHVATLGVTSGTQTFTVLGLMVDGLTLDVDFTYLTESTGGTVANIGGNPFSYGVNGPSDPGDNEIDPGETLTFSGLNATTTTPGVTLTLNSAVFNGYNWRFSGGDNGETVNANWAGGVETAPGSGLFTNTGGSNDRANFVDPDPTSFTISGGTAGSANGFGVDSLTATFDLTATAIPEPSSLGLLGLGGIAAFSRRRRS